MNEKDYKQGLINQAKECGAKAAKARRQRDEARAQFFYESAQQLPLPVHERLEAYNAGYKEYMAEFDSPASYY